GLASKLGVTKPVITRALDTMGHWGLVSRKRDPEDRRNVVIQRTVDGALFLERVGDLISSEALKVPR
ncbi:MAG: MarR family transcriptional regulator, partial [Rhizobiales bacterium]|nr:MarR family transcriptional regulator [Hyphomicrobiales bacterium]